MAQPQRARNPKPMSEPGSTSDLVTASLESVESQLGVSSAGISDSEAQARLGKYGYNELPEKKANPFLKFLSYFWGPIPWMIEVAAILSVILRHWTDFGIILALLLMNAGVGIPGGERDRRAQGQAGAARSNQTRRNMDDNPRAGAGTWRLDANSYRRDRSRRRPVAGRGPDRSGSVRSDWRIVAG